MPSMDIVVDQILVILLYVVIGFAAGKTGLITAQQRKYLSRLCSDLILPFTVLSAASQSVSYREIASLGLLLLLVLGTFTLTTAVSLGVQKLCGTPYNTKVTTAALLTYPNCTFIGLPLCRALFGDMAILYNAVYLLAFNILFFTWQYTMFTRESFALKNLVNPPTAATLLLTVMLSLGLHFPAPVQTVIANTGAMISPLSLIIVGVMMSENKLTGILKEKRACLITLIRNLLIPFAFLPVLKLLPLESASRLCLLVYLACPCGTLTTIYAIRYDAEPELAAHSVLMSTMFFALTLPVIISIGTRVL